MKYYLSFLTFSLLCSSACSGSLFGLNIPEANAQTANIQEANAQEHINPAIDMEGYLRVSQEAAYYRRTRRLSEAEFMLKSKESGVIILDARSKARYNQLHIKGAVNLSFSDLAIASLEQLIPDKNTPILIYCNNNFVGAEAPFPTKLPTASLNISTYIALYNYGYRNVFELAPLLDVKSTQLEFESSK